MIELGLGKTIMHSAIEFDDESQFGAVEVDDEALEYRLPPEFEAQTAPLAKELPRQSLRLGLVLAQLPGSLNLLSPRARPFEPSHPTSIGRQPPGNASERRGADPIHANAAPLST
jgi:hypothetical protein